MTTNDRLLDSARILCALCFCSLLILVTSCSDDDDDAGTGASGLRPANLIYSPATITTSFGTAVSSTQPDIDGDEPISFTLSASLHGADEDDDDDHDHEDNDFADHITIDADGVISADDGLPVGEYEIDVTAVNSAGTTSFEEVFTIEVEKANDEAISYQADIRPLVNNRCAPCHITGVETKWTEYNNTRRHIDDIIDRIQRSEGSTGFMPQSGSKLPQSEIDLYIQWRADGLPDS